MGQPTGESVEIIDFQKERKKKKEEKYTTQFIISSFLSPPQKKSKSRFHAVKIVTVCECIIIVVIVTRSPASHVSGEATHSNDDSTTEVTSFSWHVSSSSIPPLTPSR